MSQIGGGGGLLRINLGTVSTCHKLRKEIYVELFREDCGIEFGTAVSSLGTLYEARPIGVLGNLELEIMNQILPTRRFQK